MSKQDVGSIIRKAREDRGLSLRQAAEQLEMDWSYLRKIEAGQITVGKHAKPIARLYGLNAEDLTAKAAPSLPSLAPYLRAKYDLSDDAIAELEEVFAQVKRQKRGRS